MAAGSTHGNCSAAVAALNTLKTLETVGLDHVPVAVGAESPLAAPHNAVEVHGHDGLADVGLPAPRGAVSGESAVDQLLRLSLEREGELDLIAVGSMTNLALVLARDPRVLTRYRSVSILGGYSREPRPGDPETVDANISCSPDDGDALFAAEAPLTVVPVDTTNYSIISDARIERLRNATTPQGRLAWQILPYYFDFYQRRLGHWTSRMHDPLVAAVLLHPTLITATARRPLYVESVTGGHRAVGREGAELTGREPRPAATIVTGVDQARYLDRWVDALVTPLGELPRMADA